MRPGLLTPLAAGLALGLGGVAAADDRNVTPMPSTWAEVWPAASAAMATIPAAGSARDGRVATLRHREGASLRLREAGLRLFDLESDDPEQWRWLNTTLLHPPYYFRDLTSGPEAVVAGGRDEELYDPAQQAAWDREFTVMRAAFMAASRAGAVPPVLREVFDSNVLLERVTRWDRGQRIDVADLIGRIQDYADHPEAGARTSPVRVAEALFSRLQTRQATAELDVLVATMRLSAHDELRDWARGKRRVQRLKDHPVELAFTAHDGRRIDLTALRGKVVLVEGWSIWCAACVAAIPRIEALYQKYRPYGFEVVGLCFITHSSRDEKKTMEIIARENPSWPMWVLRDDEAREFMREHGIVGLPSMWLLGPDGRLLTGEYLSVFASAGGESSLEARLRAVLTELDLLPTDDPAVR